LCIDRLPIILFKNALQFIQENFNFMELKPKVANLQKTTKCYMLFSAP
jgi:hypothetical protein